MAKIETISLIICISLVIPTALDNVSKNFRERLSPKTDSARELSHRQMGARVIIPLKDLMEPAGDK